jgi:gluconate 2-dehydrogenase gamma chain
MKRRDFLKGGVLATFSQCVPAGSGAGVAGASRSPGQTLSPAQWSTIEAVQDHLLPSEPNAPGARDLNATEYLDRTLADPKFDAGVRSFILNGIGWLEEIAEAREGRPFHLIEPAEREDLLREIAGRSAGERWLSNLISYSLEALLGDPLYGGNPNGIGWKWLGHDPGQPRPAPDKIYGRLGNT